MTDAPRVLPFHDERCRDVNLAGGKGASLASMTHNGLPVPPLKYRMTGPDGNDIDLSAGEFDLLAALAPTYVRPRPSPSVATQAPMEP